MWTAIGAVVAAIIGGVFALLKWKWGGQAADTSKELGKAEAQRDAAQATVAADRAQTEKANAIDSRVSGDSDAQLDAGLREFQAGSSAGPTRH